MLVGSRGKQEYEAEDDSVSMKLFAIDVKDTQANIKLTSGCL